MQAKWLWLWLMKPTTLTTISKIILRKPAQGMTLAEQAAYQAKRSCLLNLTGRRIRVPATTKVK
jgi:hypothetical protein